MEQRTSEAREQRKGFGETKDLRLSSLCVANMDINASFDKMQNDVVARVLDKQ